MRTDPIKTGYIFRIRSNAARWGQSTAYLSDRLFPKFLVAFLAVQLARGNAMEKCRRVLREKGRQPPLPPSGMGLLEPISDHVNIAGVAQEIRAFLASKSFNNATYPTTGLELYVRLPAADAPSIC